MSRPPTYSHVVEVIGPHRTVYLAGQTGADASGKVAEGFRGQAVQVMENIKTALASVGGGFEHVVKLTSYLTNLEANGAEFREVRASYFTEQGGAAGLDPAAGSAPRQSGLSARSGGDRDPAAEGVGPDRLLLDLDQLDRFAARAFDHHRARVAERVGLFEERDAFAAQLGDPGVEIGDAERDVIVQLPARAGERLLALAQYQVNATSPNSTAALGVRNMPSRFERRPGPIGAARDLAVGLGPRRAAGRAPARTGALRCFWYQSCAQNGSSWYRCTWLKRSAGWSPGVLDEGVVGALACRRSRRRRPAGRRWPWPRRSAPWSGRARRPCPARCRC